MSVGPLILLKLILLKPKVMNTLKSKLFGFLLITVFSMGSAVAQKNPDVGGAPMSAKKTIVANAMNSPIHTTLVAAVKQAGLVETLQSDGPFTVFAPVNEAFDQLPDGTVETLMMDKNKAQLQTVLTYHVVPGKMDSKAIAAAIKKGDGKAMFTTVQGQKLTAWMKGDKLMIKDENGNQATVTIADVYQSNGVIHVIDTVLLPKS
jgi:uncharacterized surface protein with fasciclin (FAS1) repeats